MSGVSIEKTFDFLAALTERAEKFVETHYQTVDARDKSIKKLAVVNQVIELLKLSSQ